jgi:hypothetical protein
MLAAVGAILAFVSGYIGFLSLMFGDSLDDISHGATCAADP